MKKERLISIKNPLLRNIRNNLRSVFLTAVELKLDELDQLSSDILDMVKKTNPYTKSSIRLVKESIKPSESLYCLYMNNICRCRFCGSTKIDASKEDMIYSVKDKLGWICVNCYNEYQDNKDYRAMRGPKYDYMRIGMSPKDLEKVKKIEAKYPVYPMPKKSA